MLYMVRGKDTISTISRKFSISEQSILAINAICNREYLPREHILSIPVAGQTCGWCGGLPYYIVQPGDTLESISTCFNVAQDILAKANNIKNSKLTPYTELLIVQWVPDARELMDIWKRIGDKYEDTITPGDIHNIFYEGSFLWEAMGEKALAPLQHLLRHKADIVRLYSAVSLARLAKRGRGRSVEYSLNQARNDSNPFIGAMASYALERIRLASRGLKKARILVVYNTLYKSPFRKSAAKILEKGTIVAVLQWHIPGSIICDRIQVVESGETGFLPRYTCNEISMV